MSIIETSDAIADIASAFVKAQGQIDGAKKASNNPHFKSKYADLSQVWDACHDALRDNGLAVIQGLGEVSGSTMHMDTMLVHSSGQWFRAHASIPLPKSDPQGYGSATTYLRRYALAAMLGIVQEDDDGNAATPRKDVDEVRNDIPKRAKLTGPYTSKTALWQAARDFDRELRSCGDISMLDALTGSKEFQDFIKQLERDAPNVARTGDGLPDEFEPIIPLMAKIRSDLLANENTPWEPTPLAAG